MKKKHGDYAGVVDIARNGIDRVIMLEDECARLRAELQMLRATVVDSARDVIAWCDKNPPAGDALYCIARLRHALATASANVEVTGLARPYAQGPC
ncbi:hypothetical protein [Methylomonas koyamae]|uniref:hypothetical protein n=1 Tax=Methylomonas koyamae TaxID=702114 RepID=UPI000BC2C95D|nr:hypothetical protein [Methylomonas koyamae]ATG89885.1 hypothetical protein MKLM6_1645 [Methylomonas koyamae]